MVYHRVVILLHYRSILQTTYALIPALPRYKTIGRPGNTPLEMAQRRDIQRKIKYANVSTKIKANTLQMPYVVRSSVDALLCVMVCTHVKTHALPTPVLVVSFKITSSEACRLPWQKRTL